MKDVGKYLVLIGSTWHFRRQVPKELRGILERSAYKESLGTGSKKVAAERARAKAPSIDAKIAGARRQLKLQSTRTSISRHEETQTAVPPQEVTKTSIDRHQLLYVARLHLHQMQRNDEDADFTLGFINEDDREAELSDLRHVLASLNRLGETGDHPDGLLLMKAAMAELLTEHDLKLSPGSDGYRFLFDVTRRALIEQAKQRYRWLETGTNNVVFDHLFEGVSALSRPTEPTRKQSITVSELITRYTTEPHYLALAKATRDKYATIIRLMKETFGEGTCIRDLEPDDFKKVRDLLRRIPANATKRYKGKTFAEAAELAEQKGHPPMSPTTANSHLQFLSAIFGYAYKEEQVERNRAAGLSVPTDGLRDEEKRNPFTVAELRAIFDAPLYRGCKDDKQGYKIPGPNVPRRGRFWVPLISLFTGMRIGECCQLLTEDVAERDGIAVFINRVSNDPEKKIKTASSRRVLPVHSELKRLGFLEFVEEKRRAGEKHLFPDLRTSDVGDHSKAVSKWYGRFLVGLGIKRPDITFHSFRHSFRDALRRARMHSAIEDTLGGWANPEQGTKGVYGSGYPLDVLSEELEKVRYPGLDLSHLYR